LVQASRTALEKGKEENGEKKEGKKKIPQKKKQTFT
jgi:hypothetical protein